MSVLALALAYLLILFLLATGAFWLAGGFNPIGQFGVLPWRVPRCGRCGRKTGTFHRYQCTATTSGGAS
ncbi:hypothetical protein AB0425_17780 [Actinosynnema sp. NPDC051121]